MASMLKQRLIGAAVLIALGVIFIPMLLTGDGKFLSDDMESNVPPKPMYELEAPKVVPLDKRSLQSSEPVIEPSAQANKMAITAKQEDPDQGAKEESEKTASSKPGPAPEPAIKDSPASVEPITTSAPASTTTEKPKAVETQTTVKSHEPSSKTVGKPANVEASKKPVVSGWAVQLGSFSVEKNALKLRDSLRKKGYASFVEKYAHNGKTSFRVRVGPELTRDLANELKKKLKVETNIDGFVVEFPAK